MPHHVSTSYLDERLFLLVCDGSESPIPIRGGPRFCRLVSLELWIEFCAVFDRRLKYNLAIIPILFPTLMISRFTKDPIDCCIETHAIRARKVKSPAAALEMLTSSNCAFAGACHKRL